MTQEITAELNHRFKLQLNSESETLKSILWNAPIKATAVLACCSLHGTVFCFIRECEQ